MIASLTSTIQSSSLLKEHKEKSNLRVSIIVKENVLSVVVGLVNKQELSNLVIEFIFLPVVVVILDCHRAEFLQVLKDILVDLDWILQNLAVFIFLICVQNILHFIIVVIESFESSRHHLGISKIIRESPHVSFLSHLSNSEVLGSLASIEFDQWSSISTTVARMLASTELIEFPHDVLEIFSKSSEAN